ncbi:MAG: phosphatidylserine decarboxylase [Vicinamibacteria bacterium]|nr:phosphatidylserine decarboxylase [Vicinamibacteria bacterium]
MRIAREGLWFIVPPAVLGLAIVYYSPIIGGGALVFAAACAYFYRDPERRIPERADLVLSPADGRIVRIEEDGFENPLGETARRISIFLSILDVHINRAPIAGCVKSVEYRKGSFLPAFDHAASERNERNIVTLENGVTRVAFAQIAGIIARRIVFRKRLGENVDCGERVGMIRFGSRVDVFLPVRARILVGLGDRVHGGESILAELSPEE